jgi:DNA-binding response OmpR family regulator
MVRSYGCRIHCRKIIARLITDILDKRYTCVFIDFRTGTSQAWDFIRIIRMAYPVLPIVVLKDRYEINLKARLSEMGIFYYSILPLQGPEITALLQAIERISTDLEMNMYVRKQPGKTGRTMM